MLKVRFVVFFDTNVVFTRGFSVQSQFRVHLGCFAVIPPIAFYSALRVFVNEGACTCAKVRFHSVILGVLRWATCLMRVPPHLGAVGKRAFSLGNSRSSGRLLAACLLLACRVLAACVLLVCCVPAACSLLACCVLAACYLLLRRDSH